jgi:hypothetical protein
VFGTGSKKGVQLGKRKERGMKTRRARIVPRRVIDEPEPKGAQCDHCRGRGTCGCSDCIQGGGVCCKCGGHQFLPKVKLEPWMLRETTPEGAVRAARRPKRGRRARLVA